MTSNFASTRLASAIGFCALALAATAASAQWQWTDKNGRKVFSDRSPPSEIQEKDIVKRPPDSSRAASAVWPNDAAVAVKPASAASAAAMKTSGANAPKLSGKDAELEAKKKKAEEEERAKKKSEEDKATKVKADNCERAKTGLATLQSGVRMSAVNANGEREIFDDAKRASETQRAQEVIDASCV